jgi:L-Ala-D/L-Glu epimerase
VTTIEHIRLHPVRVPLHTPFVTSLRSATQAESLLVEVVDSDGRSGWGEAPQVWQVTGESLAGAAAAIEGPLSAQLLGRDPADVIGLTDAIERAIVGNLSAKSALDVALHDLAASTLGVPLARYLGAPADRLTVRTDVTLSVGTAEAVAQDAVAKVAAGFTLLKAKVGTDARGDVDRVRAIRAAVGTGSASGWTRTRAGRRRRRSRRCRRSRPRTSTSSSSNSRCRRTTWPGWRSSRRGSPHRCSPTRASTGSGTWSG